MIRRRRASTVISLVLLLLVCLAGPASAQESSDTTQTPDTTRGMGAASTWLPADPESAPLVSVTSDGLIGSDGLVLVLDASPPIDRPVTMTLTLESIDVQLARTIVSFPPNPPEAPPTAITERFSEAEGGWVATPIRPVVEVSGTTIRLPLPDMRSAEGDVALVVGLEDQGVLWTSAPIRVADLADPPVLTTAPWAWRGSTPVDGKWVPVSAAPGALVAPTLQSDGIMMVFTVPPAPAELGGVAVAEVSDAVLVRPEGADQAVAPFELRIDAASGELAAYESGSADPLTGTGSWRVGGVPLADGSVAYTIDAGQVLDVLGVALDDASQVALRRSVVLVDGQVAVFDSVSMRSSAFGVAGTQHDAQMAAAEASEEAATAPPAQDDGGSVQTIAVVALCVLGVGGLLAWEMRDTTWYRHRQERKRYRKAVEATKR